MEIRPNYNFYIEEIDNTFGSFEQMCRELFLKVKLAEGHEIVRVDLFGKPESNEQYMQQLEVINSLAVECFTKPPLVSYISQPPLKGDLVLEVTTVSGGATVSRRSFKGVSYAIVLCGEYRELLTQGIMSDISKPIDQQSDEVFAKLESVLKIEGFVIDDIVRQWNYIERIVDFEGENQHYQLFNDSRSYFYNKAAWNNGYPAATGIGTTFGGIVVVANVINNGRAVSTPIDNTLQVAAHEYSQEVLLGDPGKDFESRTTPKFERGKQVNYDQRNIIYISGTAAIQGEESVVSSDIITQTKTTLQNIDNLVSKENRIESGVEGEIKECEYSIFRVYIKNEADTEKVIKYMSERYPSMGISYLNADVCRDELLIEIEGIAFC